MGALVNPPNSSSRANVSNSQTGAQGVSGIVLGSINTNSGKANITTTNKSSAGGNATSSGNKSKSTPAKASGGPSAQPSTTQSQSGTSTGVNSGNVAIGISENSITNTTTNTVSGDAQAVQAIASLAQYAIGANAVVAQGAISSGNALASQTQTQSAGLSAGALDTVSGIASGGTYQGSAGVDLTGAVAAQASAPTGNTMLWLTLAGLALGALYLFKDK